MKRQLSTQEPFWRNPCIQLTVTSLDAQIQADKIQITEVQGQKWLFLHYHYIMYGSTKERMILGREAV